MKEKIIVIKADPGRIRELAAEGHSQSTIADILGVSRERIRQICNRDGIETLPGYRDWDRREALLSLAGANVTLTEAARRAGYKRSQNFKKIFEDAGLEPPRAKRNADIFREYAEAGYTLSETARATGKSVQDVWNTCNSAGVKFKAREKAAPKGGYHFWTDEQRVELLRRYNDGESIKAIADEFGLLPNAIYNQIAKVRK